MLRHPLDDVWIFLQQFFVSLLWCILDTGQEQVLVKAEPFYNFSSYTFLNEELFSISL